MKNESQQPVVRIFISSTFKDFQEERSLLVEDVFPALRRHCRLRQVDLVDIDLRIGISAEQGQVLRICLAEIDRCRSSDPVFFIGMLGERYGWVPEAEYYDEDKSLLEEQQWIKGHIGSTSVTELEMLHGVLNNTDMKPRAYFYFRDAGYSESKGAEYKSESPKDKAKLEKLKKAICNGGFKVAKKPYSDPKDWAERVKEDLKTLIDKTYPAASNPEPLTVERWRHEAYAASRRKIYFGGESYFSKLNIAMEAMPFQPVLITGASGGGKSALLANWTFYVSQTHPETKVILHHLGCSADAAEPVKLAVRLMQEIARITEQEFVPEANVEKMLEKLPEWLEKGGQWAAAKGTKILIALDGLDKASDRKDLCWLPTSLPPEIIMIASCLDGAILEAAKMRLPWLELRVEPLNENGKKELIIKYLRRYGKELTSEQIESLSKHELSENPLFLKTLLEELRVFGDFDHLNDWIKGYLSVMTIEGLFDKVFARVEELFAKVFDQAEEHGGVSAVMEILLESLESIGEKDLMEVSGLDAAKWTLILNALDESLISENGSIALGHDYVRKAAKERYLKTNEEKNRILKKLSDFCSKAMEREERKENSPYVRRQAVRHFLKAENWDAVTGALTDLEYIEVRARHGEIYDLIRDYDEAERLLPECEGGGKSEGSRQAELERYSRQMAMYATSCSCIRGGSEEPEPNLPMPMQSVRFWTDEEIRKEEERILKKPNKGDIIRAFKLFVSLNLEGINSFAKIENYVMSQAYNLYVSGPVHNEGVKLLELSKGITIKQNYDADDIYNPCDALIGVLEKHHNWIVKSLAITPNANRVASCSVDGIICIYDLKSYKIIKKIETPNKVIANVLAFTADGNILIAGCEDGTVCFWNINNNDHPKIIKANYSPITLLAITHDGSKIVAGGGSFLMVWDMERQKCDRRIYAYRHFRGKEVDGNGLPVWDDTKKRKIEIEMMTDETEYIGIVFNSVNGSVSLEGLEAVEKCYSSSFHAVSISSDGRRISSVYSDGTICIWESDKGFSTHRTQKDQFQMEVSDGAITPDGRFIVLVGFDKLQLWDLSNNKNEPLKEYKAEWSTANSILGLTDDGRWVTLMNGDILSFWDLESNVNVPIEKQIDISLFSHPITMTPDGNLFVSGGPDKILRIWNLASGVVDKGRGHSAVVQSVAITPDGARVVSGGDDKTIRLWDAQSGKLLKNITKSRSLLDDPSLETNETLHSESSINVLAISPNGKYVFSGSGDGWENDNSVVVWNIDGIFPGRKLIEYQEYPVKGIILTSDAKRIIYSSGEYITVCDSREGLKQFDIDMLKSLEKSSSGKYQFPAMNNIVETSEAVNCLAISPDEKILFSGQDDFVVRLLDLETIGPGTMKLRPDLYEGHKCFVRSVAVTPDGRKVVSGSSDTTVRIWDIDHNKSVQSKVLEGHTDSVNSLAVTPDGKYIISGSSDRTVRVWDIDIGRCLYVSRWPFPIKSICISYKYIAIASGTQVLLASHKNLVADPLIITATRQNRSEDLHASTVTSRLRCCGKQIKIPEEFSDRILYWVKQELDGKRLEGGFSDPLLLIECPSCKTKLRLNPFFIERHEEINSL